MILITGGFGKLGSSLIKKLNNNKIILIKRGSQYKKINKNTIELNLNNRLHLKKIFSKYKFNTLIHLAVTRNPMKIKTIRDFSTLVKDTLININILSECKNIQKIILASSVSIYQMKNFPDMIDRKIIIKDISEFIKKKTFNKKIIIKDYFEKKKMNININPLFHQKSNLRLNGSNKYINEILYANYCEEKNINMLILRPSRIIEIEKEKQSLKK